MSPPNSQDHRHIVEVKYQNATTVSSCKREEMVYALERGDTAFVPGRQHRSEVGVFPLNGVKYLRSHTNGYPDDNLLSLPTF